MKYELIDSNDLWDAERVWCNHYDLRVNHREPILEATFKKFTGLDVAQSVQWGDTKGKTFRVPQKAARRIRVLLSPHSYALIKAYEINHPRKHLK